MDVKKEITKATTGGLHGETSIPAVWKNTGYLLKNLDWLLTRKI